MIWVRGNGPISFNEFITNNRTQSKYINSYKNVKGMTPLIPLFYLMTTSMDKILSLKPSIPAVLVCVKNALSFNICSASRIA